MIEKCLIEHCAPTLASLKAANLFNACCEEGENIDLQISRWNQLMNPKGVKLLALRSRGSRKLDYVVLELPGFWKNMDMKIQNRNSAWRY